MQTRVIHITITDKDLTATTTYTFNSNRSPTVSTINDPSRNDNSFSPINCDTYASDPDEGSGQGVTVTWTSGGNPVSIPGF